MDAERVTRTEVEDFLFHEAALLDGWDLDGWLGLLTEDAHYFVPSNDAPDGDPRATLYTIADDIYRIRGRVKRLGSREAHAEFPRSRTRRLISNVRIVARGTDHIDVRANFAVYRNRRNERIGLYVGEYRYRLAVTADGLRIAERRAVLDSEELGGLGSVAFIL
ncbi:MAG: aromatic-ring-hydroxylating dioxygenase subunit beta [Alphaproteobacteria bacterium]|nr:aromatic-ring-hydroxylating dioxygenase subunit beta [Alphaproteobacteria bacterium]